MAEKNTVLVSGVAGYWGWRVAARLSTEPGYRVIGLDAKHPVQEILGLDFVEADIRSPLRSSASEAVLVELLKAEQVDAVCHLAFLETQRPSEAAFDLNVMGTAKVLGACVGTGVRKVVLRSSMAVYGARATNPAFLTEDSALRGSRRSGHVRNMVEIEAFCDDFRLRVPEIMLTILRFPGIVGPAVDTPLTRFLREPWAPSLLGFDPMMQVIHEDDVVEALVHAVLNDVPGVYNVAAEDVLPLSKVRGLAGKPPLVVFHKFAYWGRGWLGSTVLRSGRYMPIEADYIRYPWVGDLTRMRKDFGFVPLHAAEETLREFAQHHKAGGLRDATRLFRLRSTLSRAPQVPHGDSGAGRFRDGEAPSEGGGKR